MIQFLLFATWGRWDCSIFHCIRHMKIVARAQLRFARIEIQTLMHPSLSLYRRFHFFAWREQEFINDCQSGSSCSCVFLLFLNMFGQCVNYVKGFSRYMFSTLCVVTWCVHVVCMGQYLQLHICTRFCVVFYMCSKFSNVFKDVFVHIFLYAVETRIIRMCFVAACRPAFLRDVASNIRDDPCMPHACCKHDFTIACTINVVFDSSHWFTQWKHHLNVLIMFLLCFFIF